jgi:hypothetical protein
MAGPTDNETWLLETGDRIIQKKARGGFEQLTAWERLVYALWVADYGMRNAGSLAAARNVFADFQPVAVDAAVALSLPVARRAFSMSADELEAAYLSIFDAVCAEVRQAE